MSAVTSLPLPLSAEWIPTLLQTSKEDRKRGQEEERKADDGKIEGWIYGIIQESQRDHVQRYEQWSTQNWLKSAMQNVVHDDWVQSYGKQNVLVI